MAKRMIEADLAVGAGGATSWERCCLCLPTLMLLTADNQAEVGRQLNAAGAVILLGSHNDLDDAMIFSALENILHSKEGWDTLVDASKKVTDGLGVNRIVSELYPPLSNDNKPLRFRSVTENDSELLFNWQTNPETRRYSHNSLMPTYEEHVAWVKSRIGKVDSLTEVILHEESPAGVIRIDPVNENEQPTYIISIYIAPEKHRLGIGKKALEYIRNLVPSAELRAEVHEDNFASHALFSSAGFNKINGVGYISSPLKRSEA